MHGSSTRYSTAFAIRTVLLDAGLYLEGGLPTSNRLLSRCMDETGRRRRLANPFEGWSTVGRGSCFASDVEEAVVAAACGVGHPSFPWRWRGCHHPTHRRYASAEDPRRKPFGSSAATLGRWGSGWGRGGGVSNRADPILATSDRVSSPVHTAVVSADGDLGRFLGKGRPYDASFAVVGLHAGARVDPMEDQCWMVHRIGTLPMHLPLPTDGSLCLRIPRKETPFLRRYERAPIPSVPSVSCVLSYGTSFPFEPGSVRIPPIDPSFRIPDRKGTRPTPPIVTVENVPRGTASHV